MASSRGTRWLLGSIAALGVAAIVVAAAVRIGRARHAASGRAPTFVGSAACGACHAVEYAAWQGSQHAIAMQDATPRTVLGRFDDTRFTDDDGVTSIFFRRNGAYMVHTPGPDGVAHDYRIRYTFGVYPLQQYLVPFPGGRLQALSVAWDARPDSEGGQRWFSLNAGLHVRPTEDVYWTQRGYNWNYMCADCHSTAVRKGYDAATNAYHTTSAEMGVGCEACHGPGSRHVAWARYPGWIRRILWQGDGLAAPLTHAHATWSLGAGAPIAHPDAPASTAAEIQVCAQCHARRIHIADGYTAGAPLLDYYIPSLLMPGLYYPDGQQLAEVYKYGSFLQSLMYQFGVTCTNCHDPHSGKLLRPGNATCTACHRASVYDTPTHHHHQMHTVGAACVSCHMPDTTYMGVDARHDHSFRIPRPDLSVTLGVPNACNRCHAKRSARWAADEVQAWYPNPMTGYQRFAEAFAAADRGAGGAGDSLRAVADDPSEPPIVRASALARLTAYPDSATYRVAAASAHDSSALVRLGALQILEAFPPAQRTSVAAPLLADSTRAVRQGAAWTLAPAVATIPAAMRPAFATAASEFVASQRYNADQPADLLVLGLFYGQLDELDSAAVQFRATLRLAPRNAEAYMYLARVSRVQGRPAEADSILRAGLAAVRNDPQAARLMQHELSGGRKRN